MVSRWTGVPVDKMLEGEREKLLRMEEGLHKRVIGQEDAIKAVSQAIRRTRAGLKDPKRPSGSFIFLGPSGVGKTTLGLALGTGFCISIYSLVDGVGVRLSGNTLSYWAWGAFLHLFIAGFVGWHKRKTMVQLPLKIWAVGITGGLVSMTAYGLVLYAKNFAPLGAVSALRETSVIFATLIGFFVLKEGNWKRRLGAAVLMVFGIAFIALNA